MISNYSLTKKMTGPFTWEKFLECLTFLNTNNVDPEHRVLVIGPDHLEDALAFKQMTSSDYAQLRGLQYSSKQHESTQGFACGFHWVVERNLPSNTFYVCANGETK